MPELSASLPPTVGKAVRAMIAAKRVFLAGSCLILAVTFLLVVVLRYGLQSDLFAYEEWLLIVCIWLYFIGGAVGTYEKSHVCADILSYVITDKRLAKMRRIVVNVVEILVCLAIIYWAVLMIRDEIAAYPVWHSTIALQIPFLLPRLGILVGFLFMCLYSVLHLYVLIVGEARPPEVKTRRARALRGIESWGLK